MDYEAMRFRFIKRVVIGVIILAVVVILALNAITIVPVNHVGIHKRMGVVQTETVGEGWKFKVPFIDSYEVLSNQVKTTRIASGGANATTTDTAETSDRQLIPVFEFEIQHQLSKENSYLVFKQYGRNYENTLISSNAVAIIKQTFSEYNSEAIVENKDIIANKVMEELNKITSPMSVDIVRVNLKNYDFTPEYTAILEERAKLSAELVNNGIKQNNERIAAQTAYDVAVKRAEQDAEAARIKAENAKEVAVIEAERERQASLIRAQGQAEAEKVAVDNEAYVVQTRAEAEKSARIAVAEATRTELEAQAAGLNELVVQKAFIEKWNGVIPTQFGGGGTNVGLLDYNEYLKSITE